MNAEVSKDASIVCAVHLGQKTVVRNGSVGKRGKYTHEFKDSSIEQGQSLKWFCCPPECEAQYSFA